MQSLQEVTANKEQTSLYCIYRVELLSEAAPHRETKDRVQRIIRIEVPNTQRMLRVKEEADTRKVRKNHSKEGGSNLSREVRTIQGRI